MEPAPSTSRPFKDFDSPPRKRKISHFRGFSDSEKLMIVNVFKYVKQSWPIDKYRSKQEMKLETADILGISKTAVYRILKEYTETDVKKGQQQKQQQHLTNTRETCNKCLGSIPLSAPLVRCVQCTKGTLFCAPCLPNASHITTHALIQLPNTRVYRVLESVFDQLRLDVNELLSKNAGLLCEDVEDAGLLGEDGGLLGEDAGLLGEDAGLLGEDAKDAELREKEFNFGPVDEPLVEAPRPAAYPYLTLSAMTITQDQSVTEQLDPLNTVIKQEDPRSDEEAFVAKEIKTEEVDIEIHELPVCNVSRYVQPDSKLGTSTTARKRKAKADTPGTSAQTLEKAAVERPESSKQAPKRTAVGRPESSNQEQKRLENSTQAQERERIPSVTGVATVSSQGCEDIVIKLEPLPPEEQVYDVYVKEEPGDESHM